MNASYAQPLLSSPSKIRTDMRVNEKRKSIGVDASLGCKILGGLLTVTGSASYMNDLVQEDNQVQY